MIGRMCIVDYHTLRVIPCHETSSVKNYINVIYKHAKMTCKDFGQPIDFLVEKGYYYSEGVGSNASCILMTAYMTVRESEFIMINVFIFIYLIYKAAVALRKISHRCGKSNAWWEYKELRNRLAHYIDTFFNKVKLAFRLFCKNKKIVKVVLAVMLFTIVDLSPLSVYIPDDIHGFINHVGVPVITALID